MRIESSIRLIIFQSKYRILFSMNGDNIRHFILNIVCYRFGLFISSLCLNYLSRFSVENSSYLKFRAITTNCRMEKASLILLWHLSKAVANLTRTKSFLPRFVVVTHCGFLDNTYDGYDSSSWLIPLPILFTANLTFALFICSLAPLYSTVFWEIWYDARYKLDLIMTD